MTKRSLICAKGAAAVTGLALLASCGESDGTTGATRQAPQTETASSIGDAATCDTAGNMAPADAPVVATSAWAREAGSGGMSAAYMSLCNQSSSPIVLVGAASAAAKTTELHETRRNAQGVVSMAKVPQFALAPGQRIELAPGGAHIMLMGLNAPLIAGETTEVTLTFADGRAIPLSPPVRSAADAANDTVAHDMPHSDNH